VTGFGTADYAEHTYNCCLGDCPNGCVYCYARLNPRLDHGEFRAKNTQNYPPCDCTVMFPSTHDLFPENIDLAILTILNLVRRGCHVLVVSKFRRDVMFALLSAFPIGQLAIEFRVTLTSVAPRLYWEPNAPLPAERIESATFAKRAGFPVSFSCEPFLDPPPTILQFLAEHGFADADVWFGPMNHVTEHRPWYARYCAELAGIYARIPEFKAEQANNPRVHWKTEKSGKSKPTPRKVSSEAIV
jgi:DNA repair photolyase